MNSKSWAGICYGLSDLSFEIPFKVSMTILPVIIVGEWGSTEYTISVQRTTSEPHFPQDATSDLGDDWWKLTSMTSTVHAANLDEALLKCGWRRPLDAILSI